MSSEQTDEAVEQLRHAIDGYDPGLPEHTKLANVDQQATAIGEFLEWLIEFRGYRVGEFDDNAELVECHKTPQQLMAEFFSIDLQALEQEKRRMLGQLWAMSTGKLFTDV